MMSGPNQTSSMGSDPSQALILANSALIHNFQARENLAPALVPPEFGLTNIDWAHRHFQPGEYHVRRTEITELLGQLNQTPAILINKFNAAIWLNTLSALFLAFGQIDKPFTEFAQLEGTRADPKAMLAQNLFGTMPAHSYEASKIINDYNLLRTLRLEDVLFQVRAYQGLGTDQQRFIEEVENHLLIINKVNAHRVSIKLLPTTEDGYLDHRYFKFYKYLAEFGISGIFSVNGATSLYDLHLGRWDRKALSSKGGKSILLPQYEKSILPPPVQANLVKVKVITRSAMPCYDGKQYGTLELEIEGKSVCLEKTATAALYIFNIGQDQKYSLPEDKATKDMFDRLLDRESTPIHTEIEIDANLLKKTRSGPLRVDRRTPFEDLAQAERDAVVNKAGSHEIDTDATEKYRWIVSQLSGGGALKVSYFVEQVQSIATQLTESQVNFIANGCLVYMATSIETGHLDNLEGLEKMFDVRGAPIPMDPAIADRIRLYAEALPPGAITKIISCIYDGFVTPDVYDLTLQSEIDEQASIDPIVKAIGGSRAKSRIDFLDDFGRPRALGDFQPELTARLLDFVQECMPGVEVTIEVLFELKRFGEVIQVVQGKSSAFEKMQSPVAIALSRTLEFNMGVELPALREAIPADALIEYLALPPATELEKPRLLLEQVDIKPAEKTLSSPRRDSISPEISILFEAASDAYEEKDYITARKLVDELFERAESGSLTIQQAAYFLRIRLYIREGLITRENLKEKSGLSAELIAEIEAKMPIGNLMDDNKGLFYEIFKTNGLGGYMVAAFTLYKNEK